MGTSDAQSGADVPGLFDGEPSGRRQYHYAEYPYRHTALGQDCRELYEGQSLSLIHIFPLQREYALVPDHFPGVVPKMLVKEGEEVKAGTPLFFDKYHPEVLFCSPVSGTLAGVVRGAKRKILKRCVEETGYGRFSPQNGTAALVRTTNGASSGPQPAGNHPLRTGL